MLKHSSKVLKFSKVTAKSRVMEKVIGFEELGRIRTLYHVLAVHKQI